MSEAMTQAAAATVKHVQSPLDKSDVPSRFLVDREDGCMQMQKDTVLFIIIIRGNCLLRKVQNNLRKYP